MELGSTKKQAHEDSIGGVDLRYLKSVVLQFIDTPSQRGMLLPALATVLQCTQEEFKRAAQAVL